MPGARRRDAPGSSGSPGRPYPNDPSARRGSRGYRVSGARTARQQQRCYGPHRHIQKRLPFLDQWQPLHQAKVLGCALTDPLLRQALPKSPHGPHHGTLSHEPFSSQAHPNVTPSLTRKAITIASRSPRTSGKAPCSLIESPGINRSSPTRTMPSSNVSHVE